MTIFDFGTHETPASDVDCIIFHPNSDEPGILFWLSGDTTLLKVFHDDIDCNKCWETITEGLGDEDFVRYHDIYFRAERLKLIEKCNTPPLGHFVQFTFHSSQIFKKQYSDEQSLDNDLIKISEILGILQEIRAKRHIVQTKQ